MTARILVVEDDQSAGILLESRLAAEYFETTLVGNGREALAEIARNAYDLVVLDVLMPEVDGFEVCRTLKSDPATCHIPVIMVTALHQSADRVHGLEVGADDFLIKPAGKVALVSRVKSLVRLKLLFDELHLRATTYRNLGFEHTPALLDPSIMAAHGELLLVQNRQDSMGMLKRVLLAENRLTPAYTPAEVLDLLRDHEFDMAIIDLQQEDFDALRLCSQIRSLEKTRALPIVAITDEDSDVRLARAFDIGVNDYLTRPIEPSELVARVRTQIRRKRYVDALRRQVMQTFEFAVTDTLTGLYNRRYLEGHLRTHLQEAGSSGRTLSLAMVDVDFFKSVNDTYGHDAGDELLKELADRIRNNVRSFDLAARIGGEEFVIVMPETDRGTAEIVADRLRQVICEEPFRIASQISGNPAIELTITCSIGVAAMTDPSEPQDALFRRADLALYAAKQAGRNRVVTQAA